MGGIPTKLNGYAISEESLDKNSITYFSPFAGRGSVRALKMSAYTHKLRNCFLPRSLRLESSIGVGALAVVLMAPCVLACFSPMPACAEQVVAQSSAVVVQPGAPGMPSKTLPASARPTLPQPSQADIEFMQGMIMHHSQAVEMTALIASHTENKGVRSLGAKISSSQSDEIRFMQRWLATRGQPTSMAMAGMSGMGMSAQSMPLMPGMLTPEQMTALRNARGPEFDRLFLTGMIQHHGGALVMVKDLFDTAGAGQDAELFNFVTDVDSGQRAEIRIMQNMLEENR